MMEPRIRRFWSGGWRLLPVAALVAGCGASSAVAPAAVDAPLPATHEGARDEIVRLEQQIADGRRALGLPAEDPPPPETIEPDMARSASPPAVAAAPQASAEPEHTEVAGRAREERVCDDPCRFTKAICHAAARICRLARFLGEEQAVQRCRRAQKDCQEARRSTSGSCAGCD